MFKIGNVKLSPPLILAPMSGVSDLPFRMITRSLGCEFAFLEMISARALSYKGRKTLKMISTIAEDKPLGVQLLGAEPQYLQGALEVLNKHEFDAVDFNAACPVKKAVNRGEGASLLKDPKKLGALLKLIVDNSRAPVSVKIRSGWDENSVNALDVARYAQDAGIKTLFIHGRTKKQGYSGKVDYKIIREVKKALQIPVVGSGDALSPQLIKKMFDETGCDAVAIARGAMGNPWIFRDAKEFLKTGVVLPAPLLNEVVETMMKHFNLCCDFRGERIGVIIFRKFFYWYTGKNIGIKPLRDRAFRAKTKEQIIEVIDELKADKLKLSTSCKKS